MTGHWPIKMLYTLPVRYEQGSARLAFLLVLSAKTWKPALVFTWSQCIYSVYQSSLDNLLVKNFYQKKFEVGLSHFQNLIELAWTAD